MQGPSSRVTPRGSPVSAVTEGTLVLNAPQGAVGVLGVCTPRPGWPPGGCAPSPECVPMEGTGEPEFCVGSQPAGPLGAWHSLRATALPAAQARPGLLCCSLHSRDLPAAPQPPGRLCQQKSGFRTLGSPPFWSPLLQDSCRHRPQALAGGWGGWDTPPLPSRSLQFPDALRTPAPKLRCPVPSAIKLVPRPAPLGPGQTRPPLRGDLWQRPASSPGFSKS